MARASVGHFALDPDRFEEAFDITKAWLESKRFKLRQKRLLEQTFILRGIRGLKLLAFAANLYSPLRATGMAARTQLYVRAKKDPDDPEGVVHVLIRAAPLMELSDAEEEFWWTQDFGEALGDSFLARKWFKRLIAALDELGLLQRSEALPTRGRRRRRESGS